ncbi:DUF5709 domain-containing protein [Auraticoccus monumenti]|uniref:DUF5709 domain-containing protein n=1 Tax=Auraticoccus monumenti TaxID=675864 RepID=A0A1G7EF21_9ACTN|nr:DUF5709 domain-containing protein [Auraticoccus monumenti]SDE62233.1 hypothetical protein SAMN04489747_3925 [Auraticoccus monumenti]
MTQYNEDVPDESEQLDQGEFHRTLEGEKPGEDPLDQGWVAPDGWSAAEGYGNTVTEQREGETLDMRLAQEVPDVSIDDDLPGEQSLDSDTTAEDLVDPDRGLGGEVGDARAGRLTDVSGGEGTGVPDEEADLVGMDVGIDNAGAGAEEAAVHVIDDDVVTLPDDPDLQV